MHITTNQCRACQGPLGRPILDLANVPIGDALSETPLDQTKQAPLALHQCSDCGLLQLGSHIVATDIFNQQYPYFSSSIPSLVERMRLLAAELKAEYRLDSQSKVIEIASNDGYLLQHFAALGVSTLGIEPCDRQVSLARRKGIATEHAFFTEALAQSIRLSGGTADLLIANNVLAHVNEINDFIRGVSVLIGNEGKAVFEFHHALSLIRLEQFDTLYHQHIFYYSLTTFEDVLRPHGLAVNRVERISSYGGSLRVHVSHRPHSDNSVLKLRELEADQLTPAALHNFSTSAQQNALALRELLYTLKGRGDRIVGYGAAAKASTLLSSANIDNELLDYMVDKNAYKHGMYMPSTALKIYSLEKLKQNPPDWILVFAWNYADEIMHELGWFADAGGRFIVPSPKLAVI